jgi:uncharacterized protein (TIGR02001 family)
MTATPAAAQVGAAVSAFSDYRFRGFSLSESRPVGILDLSYDAPNGAYVAGSGSVVASREGLRTLGLQVNGGYAKQLKSGLTIDIGAAHSRYSSYSGLGSSRSYTEFYAGVRGKVLSSRVSVSPDYFGLGSTLYGEVSGQLSPARNLQVQASLGTLVPLGGGHHYRTATDGRIGLDWVSGRVSLHGAISTRGGGRNLYPLRHSSRTAVILGLSYAL